MIRFISLDMDGTLVNSRFVEKVWMEGMPACMQRSQGWTLLLQRSTWSAST